MTEELLISRRGRAIALARNPVLVAAVLALALWLVAGVAQPGFVSYDQGINLLTLSAFLGVMAIGQTIVILTGGIDLSVGATATLAAIVASRHMDGSNGRLIQAIALAAFAAACAGFINGVGVTYFRIPPLVMTLGMVGVIQGFIRLYTGGQPKGSAAPALRELVAGDTVFGIPGVLWLWAAITVAVWLLLRRTTFGWQVYAVGANPVVARLSGVRVRRTTIAVYTLSGFFAGAGGMLLLGYTETVFLRLADSYMLPTVAAVVVGGTVLIGGLGGYLGTVVGAVLLTVLDSFLKILDISESGSDAPRQIIYGCVLLTLLGLYGRQRRLRA